MRVSQFAATLAVALLLSTALHGQLQVAIVRGVVVDAQGRPIAGARVALTDPSGIVVASTASGADGTFRIADVVPGAYTVRVDVGGAFALGRPLVVRGSLPIELTLKAVPTVNEDVVVRGDASSNTAERPATIAG